MIKFESSHLGNTDPILLKTLNKQKNKEMQVQKSVMKVEACVSLFSWTFDADCNVHKNKNHRMYKYSEDAIKSRVCDDQVACTARCFTTNKNLLPVIN